MWYLNSCDWLDGISLSVRFLIECRGSQIFTWSYARVFKLFVNRCDVTGYSLRDSVNKLAVPLPRTNFLKNSFRAHPRICGEQNHKTTSVINYTLVASFNDILVDWHSCKAGFSQIFLNPSVNLYIDDPLNFSVPINLP